MTAARTTNLYDLIDSAGAGPQAGLRPDPGTPRKFVTAVARSATFPLSTSTRDRDAGLKEELKAEKRR